MRKPLKKNRLIRLIGFLGKWQPVYYISLLVVGLQNFAFNLIMALALNGLSDAALNRDLSLLVKAIKEMGIRLICVVLILALFEYLFQSSVKRLTASLQSNLFEHIQKLPMSYMEGSHSGDLLSRMTNDIQTAENAYSWQLGFMLMSVLSGIGSVVVIFTINWKLAVIGIALGFACLFLNVCFTRPIKKVSNEVQQHLSDSSQCLTDILAGSQLAKIFSLNHRLFAYYASANLGVRSSAMRRNIYQSILNGMNGIVAMMGLTGIIAIGCYMAMNNEMQVGQIVSVTQMMNGIIWMFSAIGSFIARMQGSLAGADRIFEILDTPAEQASEPKAAKRLLSNKNEKIPAVSFRDVTFSYERDEKVLDRFCADIEKNHVTALVGLSGSGKSTLFKLLQRFYRQDSGEIYLFNRPIEDYSLEELRSLIAYVPQESYLFSGTIRENIGYGRKDATFQEIEAAAKAAFADGFIRELPDGYDTQVGERGARLSGGQRQRIAIARALLKNAPILLLDEATASLDTESEQQVQKALEVLMKGRTTIVVAHRLSTIQNADNILVLEDGRVCEEGTHETLLDLNRVYARLHRIQLASAAFDEAMAI